MRYLLSDTNSGVFRIWQRGAMASARSRAPGRGVRGRSPPEAETLFASECLKEIWKRKRSSNIVEFCNSCWKMAKNAPFHIKSPVKNFHGPAKRGGTSHRGPPPKYATVQIDFLYKPIPSYSMLIDYRLSSRRDLLA